MTKELKDKVAIITGGSRGVGRAVASLFVEEGAKVVIVSRTGQEMDASIRGLKNSVIADVSNWQKVKSLVEIVLTAYETIDILVNCAAIQQPIGPFLDTDMGKWIENINVNLLGTVMCCKAVLPTMIKNNGGKIVNLSGGGAVDYRINFSAYAVSKAAVVRFTEQLSKELRKCNINVNAVAPGAIMTQMLQEAILAGEEHPQDKLGNLEDAAELILFLCSERSSGISGKLVSAVWDCTWDTWRKAEFTKELPESLYTLRRIDGRNFTEVKP